MTDAEDEKLRGYFADYKDHTGHHLGKDLFWEYDLSIFKWDTSIRTVVQRVVERGHVEDFYAMFNMYGYNRVVQTVKHLSSLSKRDAAFASIVLDIPLEEMKCSKKAQWREGHWIS